MLEAWPVERRLPLARSLLLGAALGGLSLVRMNLLPVAGLWILWLVIHTARRRDVASGLSLGAMLGLGLILALAARFGPCRARTGAPSGI